MKHAVLMEGYFDAITAWQANVTYAVTPPGTALGEHQVRLPKRETQELFLAFDRDDAGLNATQRAIELAAKSGIYIKVVRVPQGKDPDDYLRAYPDGGANAGSDPPDADGHSPAGDGLDLPAWSDKTELGRLYRKNFRSIVFDRRRAASAAQNQGGIPASSSCPLAAGMVREKGDPVGPQRRLHHRTCMEDRGSV